MKPSEQTSSSASGPLAGLRVLDLTAVVLGPLATQILGDQGADVIKVESLEGDLMRANGVSRHRGMSSIYLTINRNKRSLALDLKRPEGVQALLRLAATADVFVHNMRVPAIERLGLGYEALRRVRPDIVYCVATGYQEGGAFAGKPVFDDIVQSGCGLVDLNLRDGAQPRYMPTLVADKAAGLMVAQAVTAALLHRARTGQGQYVEVPMFEAMTAFTLVEHQGGHAFEPATAEPGYARVLNGGRRPIAVRDGHVTVLPYSPAHWQALFERTGHAALLQKYGTLDRSQLNARVRELYADLAAVVADMDCDTCLALCEALDIPATRIYALDELREHPQLVSVGLFETHEHPTEGPTVQVRPPVRFGTTPARIARLAPTLGEHSAEVLREAGLSTEEIESLAAAGAVKQAA
ncbi:MAG: CaiB/BaiF CoA transferase family protein [Gammaproteobacteria bacterium]